MSIQRIHEAREKQSFHLLNLDCFLTKYQTAREVMANLGGFREGLERELKCSVQCGRTTQGRQKQWSEEERSCKLYDIVLSNIVFPVAFYLEDVAEQKSLLSIDNPICATNYCFIIYCLIWFLPVSKVAGFMAFLFTLVELLGCIYNTGIHSCITPCLLGNVGRICPPFNNNVVKNILFSIRHIYNLNYKEQSKAFGMFFQLPDWTLKFSFKKDEKPKIT